MQRVIDYMNDGYILHRQLRSSYTYLLHSSKISPIGVNHRVLPGLLRRDLVVEMGQDMVSIFYQLSF